jgi:hypothetical protein
VTEKKIFGKKAETENQKRRKRNRKKKNKKLNNKNFLSVYLIIFIYENPGQKNSSTSNFCDDELYTSTEMVIRKTTSFEFYQ